MRILPAKESVGINEIVNLIRFLVSEKVIEVILVLNRFLYSALEASCFIVTAGEI